MLALFTVLLRPSQQRCNQSVPYFHKHWVCNRVWGNPTNTSEGETYEVNISGASCKFKNQTMLICHMTSMGNGHFKEYRLANVEDGMLEIKLSYETIEMLMSASEAACCWSGPCTSSSLTSFPLCRRFTVESFPQVARHSHTSVSPALGGLRQEDRESAASLS